MIIEPEFIAILDTAEKHTAILTARQASLVMQLQHQRTTMKCRNWTLADWHVEVLRRVEQRLLKAHFVIEANRAEYIDTSSDRGFIINDQGNTNGLG